MYLLNRLISILYADMVRHAQLCHPASGFYRPPAAGIYAAAAVVIPQPFRRGPQADFRAERLVYFQAYAVLAVVGHLKDIAR